MHASAKSVGYYWRQWKQGQAKLRLLKRVWEVEPFRRQTRTLNRTKLNLKNGSGPWFAKQDFRNVFLELWCQIAFRPAFSPGFFLRAWKIHKFWITKIYPNSDRTYPNSDTTYQNSDTLYLNSDRTYLNSDTLYQISDTLYPNSDFFFLCFSLGFCARHIKSFLNLHVTRVTRVFYTGEFPVSDARKYLD